MKYLLTLCLVLLLNGCVTKPECQGKKIEKTRTSVGKVIQVHYISVEDQINAYTIVITEETIILLKFTRFIHNNTQGFTIIDECGIKWFGTTDTYRGYKVHKQTNRLGNIDIK